MKKLVTSIVFLLIVTDAFSHEPLEADRVTFATNRYSGYININELIYAHGLGVTTVPYAKQFYGLMTMHGYKMSFSRLRGDPGLIGGIAAGILFYNEGALFPVQLDLRFLLNEKKVSPWLNGTGGVLLNMSDLSGNSRFFLNPGGGLQFKIDSLLAITIGTGLFVQWNKNSPKDSFINIKAGAVF